MPFTTRRAAVVRNIYGVSAAVLGLVLLCVATLDWAGYTLFVVSLQWR
jgi:hypothetical protein